ncbi:hypothetical protein ACH5RR_015547 [Cinchona calisaya]|uniref:Uncharacterized protein n=1 Tax=Cinchona calisaya TaxID=153742 RepID=A0ABD2ZUP3_9GENT
MVHDFVEFSVPQCGELSVSVIAPIYASPWVQEPIVVGKLVASPAQRLFLLHVNISVTLSSKTCSDHAPMVFNLQSSQLSGPEMFRFLNIWTKHSVFSQTVEGRWNQVCR